MQSTLEAGETRDPATRRSTHDSTTQDSTTHDSTQDSTTHDALSQDSTTHDSTTHVVDSVLHTAMSIGRLMRQRVAGDGLEPATYWVLKNLVPGSLRITELATSTQLDTSTVSRHVTQLERVGLVERSQDPDDGRAQRVGLTEAGRDQLEASLARRREALAATFEGWDPGDVTELDRLLRRLVSGIESRTA